MRILITGDLHYNIGRSQAPARGLARRVLETGGDALVLLGDTAGAELGPFADCLKLFDGFPGVKLLVPGNHCLWCRPGEDSLQRYRVVLPQLAADAGFTVLDHSPCVIGGVGLAGSVGWYDYSLAEESLGIPQAFYEAKVAPGAAAYYQEHHPLIASHGHLLQERHYSMGARWMDGAYIRLPMSDTEFVAQLCGTLERQLAELSAKCGRIIAFMHHVPFVELVPRGYPERLAFAAAYMGSPKFGQTLAECPKVTHVYCGHSHWPARAQVGRITAVNVGSTYVEKRLEVLELD